MALSRMSSHTSIFFRTTSSRTSAKRYQRVDANTKRKWGRWVSSLQSKRPPPLPPPEDTSISWLEMARQRAAADGPITVAGERPTAPPPPPPPQPNVRQTTRAISGQQSARAQQAADYADKLNRAIEAASDPEAQARARAAAAVQEHRGRGSGDVDRNELADEPGGRGMGRSPDTGRRVSPQRRSAPRTIAARGLMLRVRFVWSPN